MIIIALMLAALTVSAWMIVRNHRRALAAEARLAALETAWRFDAVVAMWDRHWERRRDL